MQNAADAFEWFWRACGASSEHGASAIKRFVLFPKTFSCCARVDDSLWKNPAPKPRERGVLAEEHEFLLNRTVDA